MLCCVVDTMLAEKWSRRNERSADSEAVMCADAGAMPLARQKKWQMRTNFTTPWLYNCNLKMKP